MVQVVNHGGRDAWILSSASSDNHGGSPYLRMAGTDHYALLRLQFTTPKGATPTSAKLQLHSRGDAPAQDWSAQRCSDSWGDEHVDWDHQPGVTGTVATVSKGALVDGDLIEIDMLQLVQPVFSGAKNYGWRLSVSGAAVSKIYGLDAGKYQPQLVLEFAEKPGVPVNIVPSDGSVVSDPAPTITYDYADVTGEGMAAQRIMCDPAGNFTTPAFDSGWKDATEPEFDLSASTFTPMVDGGTMQGQITVRGADGGESDPSDVFEWTYKPQVAVTPGSPSVATPYVYEPTPPVTATFDKPLSAYEVRITKQDDHTHVLYTSHKVPANGATSIAHTIPKKWRGNRILRDDSDYSLNWRAWDQETARQATSGHPLFGSAWVDFNANTDAAVGPVDTLTAVQDGITPWVILTWTRSTAPDSWVVRMDGQVVESGIDPADVLVSGSQYQWRYHGASPFDPHTFHVRAVVNGHQSVNGPDGNVTTQPGGIWLIDYDRDLSFDLGGTGVDGWQMVDQVGTYRRLDGSQMQVHTGMGGLEGHFDGVLQRTFPGRTVAELESDLYSIKERPEATLQLIGGELSIPVKIRNLSDRPAPGTFPGTGRTTRLVSFDFFQNGDLPFDVRL